MDMKSIALTVGLFVGLLAAGSGARAEVAASREGGVVLRTAALEAVFDSRGALVRLVNQRTSETVAQSRDAAAPSLVGVDSATAAGRWRVEPQAAEFEAADGDMIFRVAAEAATGDLLITQRGRSATPGVEGIRWALDGLRAEEILIPTNGGLALRPASTPFWPGRLYWPTEWEAALVIARTKRGGVAVWAEETTPTWKALEVNRRGDTCALGFLTVNQAPWTDLQEAASVTWRLTAFAGDWRGPARRYRDSLARRFGVIPLAQQQPSWVDRIDLVVLVGLDPALLEALAGCVDPTRTLLYVPNWRRDGYDRNYPDYTAADGFPKFVAAAHRLGFRVLAHADFVGCDPLNPAYARFQQYQLLNARTGQPEWWNWTRADPPIKFAYIDPASDAWRAYLIGQLKQAVERYDIDALHLDVSLLVANDARGRVDGKNFAEGHLLFQRELRAALPQVALSGEGLNEISYAFEAFAQRNILGIDHVEETWTNDLLDLAHPISTYLFRSATHCYGHLGMASPALAPQMYDAWRRAYRHQGVMPTIAWPTVESLRNPNPELRAALDEARFFQDRGLRPDLDAEWPADTLFPYRTAAGDRAAYVRDQGAALLWWHDGAKVVSRALYGVNRAHVAGAIPGWPAHSDGAISGLDPDRTYWVFREPAAEPVHIADLPAGAVLTHFRQSAAGVFVEVEPQKNIELVPRLREARTGALPSPDPAGRGGLHDVTGAVVAAESDALFMHPPWERGARGLVFAEWNLVLPRATRVSFTATLGLRPIAIGQSDGVRLVITARRGSRVRRAEVSTAGEPQPVRLDLSEFVGGPVRLRLEVDPGPAGDTSWDHALIHSPIVEVSSDRPEEIRISAHAPGQILLGRPGEAKPLGGDWRIRLPLPAGFAWATGQPQPIAAPVELWRLPFAASGESPDYTPGAGQAVCGGIERFGINAHPPQRGRAAADFFLRLPKQPLKFTGYVGLRDGSQSSGVNFIAEVNGYPVGEELLVAEPPDGTRPPAAGWRLFTVDLSAYAGQTILLSLVTDSDGPNYYDWAFWGEPRLTE